MILDRDSQSIIAQCTPKGSGGLALIRIAGDDAFEIISDISKLPSGKSLLDLPTRTIHYGTIVDPSNNIIDHVLFLLMRGPKTFIGQHTIEITCHNNPFVIERIIQLAINLGARPAQRGEFVKRAFMNGKIDLIQAEAMNELVNASNQLALRQSLSQLDGSFSRWIIIIEKSLLKCLAFSEASFEFIDEEEMEFGPYIKTEVSQILNNINTIKKTFDQQQQIRQGIRIAIIGSVNAGKSSLFNAIVNQKRSIVTEIAGTTRDTIEAGMYIDGNYWTLVDTAGLRKTENIIEQEGINRSMQEAQKADIILLVYDHSRAMKNDEQKIYFDLQKRFANKVIVIANKADLPKVSSPFSSNEIVTSSETKKNIEKLHSLISQKIEAVFKSIESPFLLNLRHFNLLLELEKKLKEILTMLDTKIAYELLSCHIKDALESLTELTGKTISEKAMDTVFKEFCVGK